MSNEQIKAVLESVARELSESLTVAESGGMLEHDIMVEVLERRLLKLLEAGQAMHDEAQGDYQTFGAAYKAWDAALERQQASSEKDHK